MLKNSKILIVLNADISICNPCVLKNYRKFKLTLLFFDKFKRIII